VTQTFQHQLGGAPGAVRQRQRGRLDLDLEALANAPLAQRLLDQGRRERVRQRLAGRQALLPRRVGRRGERQERQREGKEPDHRVT
jgi:hypothetical protein